MSATTSAPCFPVGSSVLVNIQITNDTGELIQTQASTLTIKQVGESYGCARNGAVYVENGKWVSSFRKLDKNKIIRDANGNIHFDLELNAGGKTYLGKLIEVKAK